MPLECKFIQYMQAQISPPSPSLPVLDRCPTKGIVQLDSEHSSCPTLILVKCKIISISNEVVTIFHSNLYETKKNGSRGESKVFGFFVFSHIRMMGYFRLGLVRVNEYPTGLEPSAAARNKRNATVKTRKNRPLWILPLIQKRECLEEYLMYSCNDCLICNE